MTVLKGDILFSRGAVPILVTNKNPKTGEVAYDNELKVVQEKTRNGLKNGLSEEQSAKFTSVIDEVKSEDKKEMIKSLYEKIQEIKKNGGDQRLVRYLNGELQYMMTRERFQPDQYEVDPLTLQSY